MSTLVIPAKAGIQTADADALTSSAWTPAFAGVTVADRNARPLGVGARRGGRLGRPTGCRI